MNRMKWEKDANKSKNHTPKFRNFSFFIFLVLQLPCGVIMVHMFIVLSVTAIGNVMYLQRNVITQIY